MITWMQRHKKYLVVTIWISTIAFVGAGFVGWGAYDFNTDRAAAVAKVGDKKITIQEFQMAYSNHYNYYNNIFNGELTQEKADEMGLDKIVMQNVINETLLLNYANDLGLIALDSDVKAILVKDSAFLNDGVFDKEQYYRVLKNNGLKAKEYEEGLKKQILLDKLNAITNIEPTKNERELFASAMFMKDRLSISTISIDPSTVSVDENALKAFWEPQKSKFLTKKSYVLDTIFVPSSGEEVSEEEIKAFYDEKKYNYKDGEGKIKTYEDAKVVATADLKLKKAKKAALETYLLLKKSQTEPQETKVILDGDPSIPAEKLQNVKANQVLKPIPQKDGYLVAKVRSVEFPKPMTFEEAKPLISDTFKQQQLTNELSQKAQAQLEVFKGTDIGFVSRDDVKAIAGLTEEETAVFLSKVFDNNKKKRDFVVIGNRAVLYDILEQKLLDNEKITQYKAMLDENIAQIKSSEIRQNLITALRKRYSIEQYYKGK